MGTVFLVEITENVSAILSESEHQPIKEGDEVDERQLNALC